MPEVVENYTPAPDLLKDKIILVTGAGDGIGRVAAKTFAQHGATVILLGRTTAKLEQVYDEIESAGGPQPAIFPMDLNEANQDTFEHFAEAVDQEFGRLDGLLHNASLLGQRTPIANYNYSAWQQVMQVNVNAVFGLTRFLLPLMEQPETASILMTSSSVGRKGRAYWGAYSVSKFAAEGLMQVLADELDGVSQVRVNSINPGGTRTNMRAAAYPAEDPQTVVPPEALMNTYLYLMGDDSRGVSGQEFNAQG